MHSFERVRTSLPPLFPSQPIYKSVWKLRIPFDLRLRSPWPSSPCQGPQGQEGLYGHWAVGSFPRLSGAKPWVQGKLETPHTSSGQRVKMRPGGRSAQPAPAETLHSSGIRPTQRVRPNDHLPLAQPEQPRSPVDAAENKGLARQGLLLFLGRLEHRAVSLGIHAAAWLPTGVPSPLNPRCLWLLGWIKRCH